MKKLPTGFASPIILIAVGLIVGIGITFAYFQFKPKPAPQPQPTPISQSTPTDLFSETQLKEDETANWRTYTNTTYGFSLKYPSEFQYITESPNASVLILNDNFKAVQVGFSNSNSGLGSSMIFWSTNEKMAIDNLNKLMTNNNYKKVTVGGYSGVYMESKATGGTDQPLVHWYYFGEDERVIAVQGNYVETTIIEKILSTFKFE